MRSVYVPPNHRHHAWRRRARHVAPLALVVVAALGIGIAHGATRRSDDVVRGCYSRLSGELRVIPFGRQIGCLRDERSIAWNQRGPRGRSGARGLTGPRGLPGPPGPAGVSAAALTVYQGDIKNVSIVLAGPSNPTHIVDTPPLPAGTYLVSYSVGFVLGHLDNAVCAAAPASTPHANDGVFGVGGNGATESGTGAGGIYANGVAVDTITIANVGDRISIYCNSANVNRGTYVGGASIVATPVQRVISDHQ